MGSGSLRYLATGVSIAPTRGELEGRNRAYELSPIEITLAPGTDRAIDIAGYRALGHEVIHIGRPAPPYWLAGQTISLDVRVVDVLD